MALYRVTASGRKKKPKHGSYIDSETTYFVDNMKAVANLDRQGKKYRAVKLETIEK